MVKIHVPEDCGNAPKILFLRDFIRAVVKNDKAFLAENTTEDIQWNVMGSEEITGKQSVLRSLARKRSVGLTELRVTSILTHGYNGAIEGILRYKNGKRVAFCDICQFRSSVNHAPVRRITTYLVNITEKKNSL